MSRYFLVPDDHRTTAQETRQGKLSFSLWAVFGDNGDNGDNDDWSTVIRVSEFLEKGTVR